MFADLKHDYQPSLTIRLWLQLELIRSLVYALLAMCVCACACAQGLSAEVQQRLPQWKFSAPVRAHLHVPTDLSQAEAQTALQAALSQLSVLPPGTEVYLNDDAVDADWSDMYPAAVAAIAATTHTTQHLSIVLPACYGVAELYFSMLDSPHGQQRASRHVRLSGLKLSPAHAAIPWPWESVRVGSVGLSDLLLFPDPTGGQYEVTLDTLDVRTWEEVRNWHAHTHTHTHTHTQVGGYLHTQTPLQKGIWYLP